MCDNFIPLVKKGGRVVNVASVAGHLNGYSADAKKRIQEATSSVSAVMDVASEYEVRWRGDERECR
jgi:NAD(P)-dependent dehydrogenase (short-subunit alcohol dehydrogenase family)